MSKPVTVRADLGQGIVAEAKVDAEVVATAHNSAGVRPQERLTSEAQGGDRGSRPGTDRTPHLVWKWW